PVLQIVSSGHNSCPLAPLPDGCPGGIPLTFRRTGGVRLPSSAVCARNPDAVPVLRPRVMSGRSRWRGAGVMAAAVLGVLLLGPARPASAHVRVFVGGAVGFPVYPYPYYYPYAPYPEVPPPGWEPGRWE